MLLLLGGLYLIADCIDMSSLQVWPQANLACWVHFGSDYFAAPVCKFGTHLSTFIDFMEQTSPHTLQGLAPGAQEWAHIYQNMTTHITNCKNQQF